MTVANVPIIDLELDHYMAYIAGGCGVSFQDDRTAKLVLRLTARFLDECVVVPAPTLEQRLDLTVQM